MATTFGPAPDGSGRSFEEYLQGIINTKGNTFGDSGKQGAKVVNGQIVPDAAPTSSGGGSKPKAAAPKAAAPKASSGGGGGNFAVPEGWEIDPNDKSGQSVRRIAPTTPAAGAGGGAGAGAGGGTPEGGGDNALMGLMGAMGGGEGMSETPRPANFGPGLRAGLGQRAYPQRNVALAGLGKVY